SLLTLVLAAGKECPSACTMQYDPVCAEGKDSSAKTFSNSCAMDVYNCNNPDK
ncbi:hypothetical protein L9F63_012674, partial [Diploptera punctata]